MPGATVFNTLVLTKGYHQLVLHPKSKPITVFFSPKELFRWKVLPLGMKTAGAVFQRIMDKVVRYKQPHCVLVYIDDITVYIPSLQQHLVGLNAVFTCLEAKNLNFSVSKTRLV